MGTARSGCQTCGRVKTTRCQSINMPRSLAFARRARSRGRCGALANETPRGGATRPGAVVCKVARYAPIADRAEVVTPRRGGSLSPRPPWRCARVHSILGLEFGFGGVGIHRASVTVSLLSKVNSASQHAPLET